MRSSPALDWLVARPIAHRGLHDAARGVVENSCGAARAAIEHGFAIECDVQVTQDGDAVVFHDFDLDRLTSETGPVAARRSTELTSVPYTVGSDRICTLATLLALVAGRVPLICEIKSRFDGDLRLTERVRDLIADYAGPLAIKSFDPAPLITLRAAASCPLGIVAEAEYNDREWADLSPTVKRDLAEVLHFDRTQPDFISYHVGDLPHAVPYLCRAVMGRPVIAWTVRTSQQRTVAAAWADQMVFEGFIP